MPSEDFRQTAGPIQKLQVLQGGSTGENSWRSMNISDAGEVNNSCAWSVVRDHQELRTTYVLDDDPRKPICCPPKFARFGNTVPSALAGIPNQEASVAPY